MIPFQDVTIGYDKDQSGQYTIATDATQLKAFKLLGLNDALYTSTLTTHFWSHVGSLYNTFSFNQINQDYVDGGLNNTMLQDLVTSFGTTGAVMIQLGRTTYRSNIDGVSVGVKIPLNASFSGITSGLSSVTLYSSYVYTPDSRSQLPGQLCGGCIADNSISEPSTFCTSDIGFGYTFVNGTNPDPSSPIYDRFDSGGAFMFTDHVYNTFTGATGSSQSWSVGFAQTNPYATMNKRFASFNASKADPSIWTGIGGHDRASGWMDFKSGILFLWGPLAQAFDWTQYSGDYYTTGATPTTSATTVFQGSDYDYRMYANATLIVQPGQITASDNESYLDTNGNCNLVFSGLCVKDRNGNTVAISKPDQAITFDPNQFFITSIELPISGDMTVNNKGITALVT